MDETSFSVVPPENDWDHDVTTQHQAPACRRAGDLLGVARARNALGLPGGWPCLQPVRHTGRGEHRDS